MENTYGIGVKNRYALFYNEEEDPLEILKAQEEEREKKKEHKHHEKENKGTKGATVSPSPAPKTKQQQQNTIAAKKGVKEVSSPKTTQELPPKKEVSENNKSRSQKAPVDRNVKFSSSPREVPQDLEEKKNRRNRDDRNRDERGPPPTLDYREPREPRMDGELRRGGGRGGIRGGRGRGRGRGGFDNRGKREFDRQSGSDKSVKPFDKRDGAGSHNWGTVKDDMEEMNNTAMSDENTDWAERTDENAEQPPAAKVEEPVPMESEGGDEAKPTEEEPRQMTLDEWRREQEKNRAVPHFNLRKPGEGEDTTQWKKTYVLKKKEEEEGGEGSEEEDEEEVVRRGRQKHLVDIEINFSDSRRGRGRGRGGRGGGGERGGGGAGRGGGGGGGGEERERGGERGERGGGGGGGGGGGRDGGGGPGGPPRGSRTPRSDRGFRPSNKGKSQSAPKVDDENDFPSLQTA